MPPHPRKTNLDSCTQHYTIVASANVLDPTPEFIRVDAAGTATLEDEKGVSIVYNVLQGERIPFQVTKVTALSGAVLIAYH